MKQQILSSPKNGINRLRTKGGANNESLYDLVNGYVETAGTVRCRPGSVKRVTLPANTAGLSSFSGKLIAFSSTPKTSPNPLVDIVTLRHPTGLGFQLSAIHYAAPFLGKIYVVAEFSNGDIFHYWVQDPAAWQANTVYDYGQTVQPAAENGFVYKITNIDAALAWQANTEKTIGSVVQPTEYNGFKFEATAVTGTAPIKTSDTEPDWPAEEGAIIVERRYLTSGTVTTPGSGVANPPSDIGVDDNIDRRYKPYTTSKDPREL